MDIDQVRLEALRFATQTSLNPTDILDVAQRYYDWLMYEGEDED